MDDSELALERALQQLRSESPEPCSVMESSTYGSLPELENSRFCKTKLREAHSLMEDSIYCSADSLFSHHTMENSSTDKGLIYRQLAIYSPEDWSGSQWYPDSAKATVGNNAAARPSITASHLAHFAASDNVESRPLSSTPLKPVSREEVFFWDVCERLLAVAKDRESMTFQVRSLLRQRGKSYDEIMSAEWYNLSEVEPSLDNLFFPPRARALPSPSTHHLLSPLEPPAPYLDASKLQGQPWSKHNVRQIPRREGVANRKCCCNYCGPSDSGVGVDMHFAANDLPKSANSDHIHAYVRQRNQVASILPERQRSAQAAASALMSNSPQPEELNFHGNTCRYYDNGRYYDRQVNGIIPRRAGQQNFNTNHSFPATQLRHNKNSSSLTKQHVKALPRSRVLTLVVYTLNELSIPYAKKLSGTDFTLKDFKEKVFGRTGEYRYFFKDFFPDVNMEVFEELSDEAALLPVLGGKIEARVEKM